MEFAPVERFRWASICMDAASPARVGGHRGFSLQGAISIACLLAGLMPPPSLVEAQDYLRRAEEVLQWLLSQL